MKILLLMLISYYYQPDSPMTQLLCTYNYGDFLGWHSDTAYVRETVYHDLADITEETHFLITNDGYEEVSFSSIPSTEPGTVVISDSEPPPEHAAYELVTDASEEDLEFMCEACLNFEEYLDANPPTVPVQMSLIRTEDSTVVWNESRILTWFGGECAPIFFLPGLDQAVLSPDSTMLFFSVLYGPFMEYYMTPSGI